LSIDFIPVIGVFILSWFSFSFVFEKENHHEKIKEDPNNEDNGRLSGFFHFFRPSNIFYLPFLFQDKEKTKGKDMADKMKEKPRKTKNEKINSLQEERRPMKRQPMNIQNNPWNFPTLVHLHFLLVNFSWLLSKVNRIMKV